MSATVADNAICLRRWAYSETSQTVSLFTREHGRLRGLAKGSRRPKSRYFGGFDVLTRGQVVLILRSGRELQLITEWHLEDRYDACRASLAANRAGVYMADLAHQLLEEEDPHPRLFDALDRSLRSLDNPETIEWVMLRYQLEALREGGYQPILAHDAQTGLELSPDEPTLAFSAEAGGTVEDTGEPDRWRVRRATIELLQSMQAADRTPGGKTQRRDEAEQGHTGETGNRTPPPTATTLRRANLLLAAYVRELLGHEPASLRWAFPDLPR